MGTYRPLYSLRVEHDYYDNLACRALSVSLTISTGGFLTGLTDGRLICQRITYWLSVRYAEN